MVNISFLENFTKADSTKMKRYIALYIEVANKTFDAMQQNLENEDWEALRVNAHSLKPQIEFMGIEILKEVIVKIENNVLDQKLETLQDLFDSATRLHLEAIRELNHLMNELS